MNDATDRDSPVGKLLVTRTSQELDTKLELVDFLVSLGYYGH